MQGRCDSVNRIDTTGLQEYRTAWHLATCPSHSMSAGRREEIYTLDATRRLPISQRNERSVARSLSKALKRSQMLRYCTVKLSLPTAHD